MNRPQICHPAQYCVNQLKFVLHGVDHEVTRKADSNFSHIIIRHRFHLVPLPFLFVGLLEGSVVIPTGICSYSSSNSSSNTAGPGMRTCMFVFVPDVRTYHTIQHGKIKITTAASSSQQSASMHISTAPAVLAQYTHSPHHTTSCSAVSSYMAADNRR